MGYFLLCPVRRFGQNPDKILSPYIRTGMTVLDVGPGMGFFTLPMARLVGAAGTVVCIDVRSKMLDALRRRAAKAGLADRIDARICQPTSLGIGDLSGKADFVLLFAVTHEVPDADGLFEEVARAMKPGGRCLLAEPRFHVPVREFDRMLAAARQHGLHQANCPKIRTSHAALLVRTGP